MILSNMCLSHVFGKFIRRNFKTNIENKTIKYTNSINLPKTKFPTRLNPNQRAEIEAKIRNVRNLS